VNKRLFVALKLPGKTVSLLAKVQKELKKKVGKDSVKWVEKSNFHQALIFLGEVEEKKIKALQEIIAGLASNNCLKLSLKRLAFSPDLRRPRVVSVNLDGDTTRLSSCYHQLRLALRKNGFQFDVRFSPCVCLGRVRPSHPKFCLTKDQANKINEILRERDTDFVAKDVVLFESKLTPKGPVYTPIWRIKLNSD